MHSSLISRLWTWIALLLPVPIMLWSLYLSLSVAQLQREIERQFAFIDRIEQTGRALDGLYGEALAVLASRTSDASGCRRAFNLFRERLTLLRPGELARSTFEMNLAAAQGEAIGILRVAELAEGANDSAAPAPEGRLWMMQAVRNHAERARHVIDGWTNAARDEMVWVRSELGARWGSLTMLVLVACVMSLLVVILMHSYRISVIAREQAEFERDRFFMASLDMQFIADLDGVIKQCNRAWLRTLGHAPEKLEGTALIHLVHAEDRRATLHELERLRSGVDIISFENRVRAADGEIRWMLWSATQDIQRSLVYGTIRDITDRKLAQLELKRSAERLAESNRELDAFASAASHDLQEPLNKLMTFGERLAASGQLDESARDYVGRIRKAAQRMKSLIEGLLEFSRVTTQGRSFEPVDLNRIVADVLGDLEVRVEQSGARIHVDALPLIDADPTQMRQLFQNLISNALKFHRPGGAPEVRILDDSPAATNGQARIVVEDRGVGFDEAQAARMFEIFERLPGSAGVAGAGVGLAICRKIVERHGGQISAASRAGGPTRFLVTLPLRHEAAQQAGGEAVG